MATSPALAVNGGSKIGDGGLNYEAILPYVVEKFIDLMVSALIIVAAVFLIRIAKVYLRKLQTEHEQQRTALNLFEKLVTGFLVVIAITLALKNLGIDMSLLVSVTILGLSYGLQDVIKNYVAGILILFKSPFRLGDLIKIKDFVGKVEKIDFQATTLRTFDRRFVTIYNSDVMTQAIVNFSNSTIRRLDLPVTIGYGTNTQKALQYFEKALELHPGIMKNPSYKIVFKKFSDNGLEYEMRAWVQLPANVLKIKSELALTISKAFDEKEIFMPYSKDIQLEQDYTLGERRDADQQKLAFELPLNQPALATEAVSESIDFEELE